MARGIILARYGHVTVTTCPDSKDRVHIYFDHPPDGEPPFPECWGRESATQLTTALGLAIYSPGTSAHAVPHDCLTREHDPDEWCPDCFPVSDSDAGQERPNIRDEHAAVPVSSKAWRTIADGGGSGTGKEPGDSMTDGVDLSPFIRDAILEEIENVVKRQGKAKNKREGQRVTIRAVQRFMDGQKARVRNAADHVIREEETDFSKAIEPLRILRDKEMAALDEEFRARKLEVETRYNAAIKPFRDKLYAEIRSVRDDLSKRIAEADRITHDVISDIKKGKLAEGML